MIDTDDIEEVLSDTGLLEVPDYVDQGPEYDLQLNAMLDSLNALLVRRMRESAWFAGEDPTKAEIDGVPEGLLFEDVDAFDVYKLWRDDMSELDEGPWNSLSVDSTRRWEAATAQLLGELEGKIRDEIKGDDPDSEEPISLFLDTDPYLPAHMRRTPHKGQSLDTGMNAVQKAIARDVIATWENRAPMVGDDVTVKVGGKPVPARIIAIVGQRGARKPTGEEVRAGRVLYELQRTDNGRKLRKPRQLSELRR